MVRKCLICGKADYLNPNLSFHRFPSDMERRNMWFSLLNIVEPLKLPQTLYLCTDHFDPKDFDVRLNGTRYLKSDTNPVPLDQIFEVASTKLCSCVNEISPFGERDHNFAAPDVEIGHGIEYLRDNQSSAIYREHETEFRAEKQRVENLKSSTFTPTEEPSDFKIEIKSNVYPKDEEEFEEMDIVEQFIDETGIHDRETFILKDECIELDDTSPKTDRSILHSLLNQEKNQEFKPKLDDQKDIPSIQKKCNSKKKRKSHEIMDWKLLIKIVMQKPRLWKKFLSICADKISKTATWRDACLILMKEFESLAQQDQENTEQLETYEADIRVFATDQWGVYFYLMDPDLSENNCFTVETSLTNSTAKKDQNPIEETEKKTTECQPTPSLEPNVSTESETDSMIYRRKQERKQSYCYFCERLVSNFARHVVRVHSTEPEVQGLIFEPKKSNLRKELLTRLRKKGNYLKCLKLSKIPKPQMKKGAGRFNVCPFCLGFYSYKMIRRHKLNCKENPSHTNTINETNEVFEKTSYWAIRKKVFPRMRLDKISAVAQRDILICELGTRYLENHRDHRIEINITSQKMRQLSRLLIEMKRTDSSVTSLMDIIHPKYYNAIVKATKRIAKYDEHTKRYKAPNYAKYLGMSLKHCCEIALDFAEQKKYIYSTIDVSDAITAIRIFSTLVEGAWKNDLFKETPVLSEKNDKPSIETKVEPDSDVKIQTNTEPQEQEVTSNLSNKKNETNIELQEQEVTNIITNTNDETLLPDLKECEEPKKPNVKIKRRTKKGEKVPWTMEQKKVVTTFFKWHIENKKPPIRSECEVLKQENKDLLSNKDWLKIKVFIQNVYTNKCKRFFS